MVKVSSLRTLFQVITELPIRGGIVDNSKIFFLIIPSHNKVVEGI